MKRTLILRFDIDTYRCISQGVPSLLRLAREMQVRFTFFCNMGRAISRRHSLHKLFARRGSHEVMAVAPKLPNSVKQGYYQLLLTLLFNPMVGMSHTGILRQAYNEGHDIGLHGGRNHGAWQHGFRRWNLQKVCREIASGTTMFEHALGCSPTIFSSPGWQGSDELNWQLRSFGFTASADRHGPGENDVIDVGDFCTLPTNLVAEPGGVAYFESLAAQGFDEDAIADTFERTLSDGRDLYVLYDHPCFAGIRGIDFVRRILHSAIDNSIHVTTFSELMQCSKKRD